MCYQAQKAFALGRAGLIGGAGKTESKSEGVYYIQDNSLRHDTFAPSGSHIAIMRHCDTGISYFVDFDRREYYSYSAENNHAEASSGLQQKASSFVQSETHEVGKTQVLLGHTARHLITRVTQSNSGSRTPAVVEEVIDGWYLTDVKQPQTNCMPQSAIDDPSSLIGAPMLPPDGTTPEFKHSGPMPNGLAARVKRTRYAPSDQNSESSVVLEQEVIDFSGATVDPRMFEPPAGFRNIPKPSK